MASIVLKNPSVRYIVTRGYAQAAPAAIKKDVKIETNVSPSKISLTALDNGSPVTRVTIAFKAGSRYEPQTELGISHVLRSAAGLSTKNANTFITARKLAQIGASVTASGDREFVYYTLEASQENLLTALEYLNNIVSNQEFRPWELSDNTERLKYDTAALPPQVRAIDLLHKAAFRRGLGNSLFISPNRISQISSESLQHFASVNLTPTRCAITVVGDNMEKADLVAKALQLSTNEGAPVEASVYYGGDLRKEIGGDLVHVALALQGAPAGSPHSLALAVAAKALGNGPVTKWGSVNSPLSKAIGNIGPFAVAGFNVSYTDNGLFGLVLSAPKDVANNAIKAAAKVLKNPSLSGDAIKAGKNQLKLQVLSEAEDGTSLAESLACQALYTGSVKSPADIARDIDSLSNSDITQAMSNAAKNRITMSAVGNLSSIPYSDEL